MHERIGRRTFLGLGVATAIGSQSALGMRLAPRPLVDAGPDFPRQDSAVVTEMVVVAHSNLTRVKELLDRQPALAKANIDWGFGDWESAVDAASHTGRREIALMLIEHGARPTLHSAAMLGQQSVVQAWIEAIPGSQRTYGPHSITLLSHARAGGDAARAVVEYLEHVGDADILPATVTLSAESRRRLLGTYAFGAGADERLDITEQRDALQIKRLGRSAREIRCLGGDVFYPRGGESVRVRFDGAGDVAQTVAVYDPDLLVTARRAPS